MRPVKPLPETGCGGAGPSQVDEILLGRDIDGSTTSTLKQLEFSRGAAGCKSIGVAPKLMGKRCVPGGASEVDELIWGTDVDGSSDPVFLKAKDQLFRGAAGVPGAAVAGAGVGKMPLTSRGPQDPRKRLRQNGRGYLFLFLLPLKRPAALASNNECTECHTKCHTEWAEREQSRRSPAPCRTCGICKERSS